MEHFPEPSRARAAALMPILTDKRIRALHEKYAPSAEAFDLVHTHCEIVCRIAEQILTSAEIRLDADLVRAGSLLHDIGVYRLYSSGEIDHAGYLRHGVLGHEILREEGFPEVVCRFCSCHTGVGLSREDKVQRFTAMVERFGEPDLARFAAEYGHALV